MSCRFYGKNSTAGELVDSQIPECGLMSVAYAPCSMKRDGVAPDDSVCPRFAEGVRIVQLFIAAGYVQPQKGDLQW